MAIELLNTDCNLYMATLKDKEFDLAICDPPFFKGPNENGYYDGSNGRKQIVYKTLVEWSAPGPEYYAELKRVSKNQIIWGINYFNFSDLPTGRNIWDKRNDTSTFSDAEIASNSLIKHVKIFRYKWNGMLQEDMQNKEVKIHPTQKPVALYKWLLKNYAKPGDKILDTHLGSASSAIAAHQMGFDFVGTEIDKDYYEAALKRYNEAIKQQTLFNYQA